MKINWDRWVKRDRGSLIFIGFLCLFCAIAFLYIDLTKPEIKDKNDLIFITAPITDFNFYDGNRGIHIYTIRLKNYRSSFQIKADFLSFFKSDEFRTISSGQDVTVAIPRVFEKALNSDKTLLIYSLTSNNENFLDCAQTIEKHNSNLIKYFSVLATLIGIVFIYFGNKAKDKTTLF